MNGRIGWLLILAVALIVEVMAVAGGKPNLTSSFRHWTYDHPIGRWILLAVLIYLLVHLFATPAMAQHDPLDKLFYWIDRKRLNG